MTESTNFDPNALEVLQGNHRILLASWRFPRDGNFAPLWNAANSSRGTLSLAFSRVAICTSPGRRVRKYSMSGYLMRTGR